MEIVLPENHILYTSANDVKQICTPLKNYFDIAHFSFVKINPDLSRFRLDTNIEWNKYFFRKYYQYYFNNNLTEGLHWHSGYSLIHTWGDYECIVDAKNFNIGNGIIIANHINGYTELAFFALSNIEDNSKITKLLNNIDMLENFIQYFKYTAAKILIEAEKTPINITFLTNNRMNDFSVDIHERINFLDNIRVPLKSDSILTKRERECIQYLSKDMQVKEIARTLNISPRTVKQHLANARFKVGCRKSATLIEALKQ